MLTIYTHTHRAINVQLALLTWPETAPWLCFCLAFALGQVCNGVSSAISAQIQPDSQLAAKTESQANMCCHMLQQQQQLQLQLASCLAACLLGYSNCAQAQLLLVTLQTFQLPSRLATRLDSRLSSLVLATLRLLHTNAAAVQCKLAMVNMQRERETERERERVVGTTKLLLNLL